MSKKKKVSINVDTCQLSCGKSPAASSPGGSGVSFAAQRRSGFRRPEGFCSGLFPPSSAAAFGWAGRKGPRRDGALSRNVFISDSLIRYRQV